MRQVFFCDTNLLLQCKKVESLPWGELTDGAPDVLVYIPRTVQTEIDRLKQDGNSRRSRKAREVSSWLREMVRANECRISFSSGGTTVSFILAGPRSKAAPRPDDLDLDHNDDRIVDEALAWSHMNAQSVSLLTHDVGMMTTARHYGLSFVEIPSDWLLSPEPDERDKKIAAYEKEITSFKATHPAIRASFSHNGKELDRGVIEVEQYRRLSDQDVDILLERIKAYHPQETIFKTHPPDRPMNGIGAALFRWRPPSEQEIREYTEYAYPAWLKQVRDRLSGLAVAMEYPTRRFFIDLDIENTGFKSAQSARVQLVARGGLMLLPEPEDDEENCAEEQTSLPPPPQPPAGKWGTGMFDLGFDQLMPIVDRRGYAHLLSANLPPRPRDPNKFYWEEGRHEMSAQWELTCQEFMHKVGPISFQVPVFVPSDTTITRGAIELTVAAANLPEPFRKVVPVEVRYHEASIDEVVDGLIARL